VDKVSFTAVPVTDPWNRIPFIPYVYRGTGVDTMKVKNLYGTLPQADYTRCKRCGRNYKSKYHKENRGGEHNAH
jgi:hypothetical protein